MKSSNDTLKELNAGPCGDYTHADLSNG